MVATIFGVDTDVCRDHNKELWVKTLSDGWLTAKRSQTTERELYAFYDTKIASIGDLYGMYSAYSYRKRV